MLLVSLLANSTNPIIAIIYIAVFFTVLFCTIAVHEYCHARAAEELGDPTARLMGRLTLNPKAHIDPVGALLLLVFGFGWGKPVPFDPYNLKDPRRDAALISLAGPASNLVMAVIFAILYRLLQFYSLGIVSSIGLSIIPLIININILLGLFNLLPFAPLDGFKIVAGFLSEEQARNWYDLERFGVIFLIAFILPLVNGQSMLQLFLGPVINFTMHLLIP